jgi:hypothetical protein
VSQCHALANNIKAIIHVFPHGHLLVQALEPTALAFQQFMRPPVLDKLTPVHDNDLVKVKYGVKFVRHRNECVVREGGTKEALDMSISCCVKARRISVSDWRLGKIKVDQTYLLVASSIMTTLALSFLNIARAKQNNWRWP